MHGRLTWLIVGTLLVLSAPATADGVSLVQDGRARGAICLARDATPRARAAAETLRVYLRRISGAAPRITHANPHRGDVVLLRDASANRYGPDGFTIRTADGQLHLVAASDQGLQNAVYTLLETYLGCRMYSPSVRVIPPQRSITLPDIDDTQIPVLTWRLQDFQDPGYNAWHKLSSRNDWGLFVHTFARLVPPGVYFAAHPEYFSENQGVRVADGQLCLSNPDVLDITVANLHKLMAARPDAHVWSVSQNDTYLPCQCPRCAAIDSAAGSPSGSILCFVNEVAAAFPDETISTLAYQYSRQAPVGITPLPNVNIMLCSIECDRSRPLADDPNGASFVKDLHDWSQLTHNLFVWDYVIQFRNLVSPFPNLRVLQPNLQLFVQSGVTGVFEQGLPVMRGEFAELRAYLISKLLWNPDVDVDAVMDDFLHGFYGAAAPYVRQYIDEMHDALARSGEGLSCFGYPWSSADGYLSAAMIDRYIDDFDRAEAAVSADPIVLRRVQTARLPLQYARLEQAKFVADGPRGCFTRDAAGRRRVRPEITALLTSFCDRCEQAGIPRLWEHGIPPEEYRATTQAFLDSATSPNLALGKPVTLAVPASAKYAGGDAAVLTDGLSGWNDYHMHWLGSEGGDLDAVIDLGTPRLITRIQTRCLQDIESWIFLPTEVDFLVSDDGVTFRPVGTATSKIPPQQEGAIIADYGVSPTGAPARFVRVVAHGLGTCPSWHKGAGGKAWVFADEIKVF